MIGVFGTLEKLVGIIGLVFCLSWTAREFEKLIRECPIPFVDEFEEGPAMVGKKSPWAEYAAEVTALFDKDDDVVVAYDNEEPCLTLYVGSAIKADALTQLFPENKEFGNVTMRIEVLPANDKVSVGDLFSAAFNGNPVFGGIYDYDNNMGYKATFALFEPKVIQYYSDDLSEYGGVTTKTVAQIANDVFDTDEVRESVRISSLHMAQGIIV